MALIRQKSKFVQKRQSHSTVRRLSQQQWQALIQSAESMAEEKPESHERTLFMISTLYGMYLWISELGSSERWTPSMNDFHKDHEGRWWFTTVGKGNKERQIAVSDTMLARSSVGANTKACQRCQQLLTMHRCSPCTVAKAPRARP